MIFANLSKREKFFAVLTVLIIGGIIFYTQVIDRVAKKWSNLNDGITAKSVKLKKDTKLLAKKNIIEKEYKNYLSAIKSGLSEEEEAAGILLDIETIAKQDAFAIINIKPSATKDMAFYKELAFEISAESTTDELVKFIFDIQSLNKLLKVKRLNLSTSIAKPGTIKSSLEVTKIIIK